MKIGIERQFTESRMRVIAAACCERKFELVCGYTPTTLRVDQFYTGLIRIAARTRIEAGVPVATLRFETGAAYTVVKGGKGGKK